MKAESGYAELCRLLTNNPRDRAIRVDRTTLQVVLREMRWAANKVRRLEEIVSLVTTEPPPASWWSRVRAVLVRFRFGTRGVR